MEQLPVRCHDIPLNCLAIPGSHDSFTYYLDKGSGVTSNEPVAIRTLSHFGPVAKHVIYNWSVTQTLSVADQLLAGIRYFDIRLATRPRCAGLFCVHGLYGLKIDDVLAEIDSFLESHEKEVVLLDFKSFCDFDGDAHDALAKTVMARFGSRMCRFADARRVTLDRLWRDRHQVVAFYHHRCHGGDDGDDDAAMTSHGFWPGDAIRSPWPNTTDVPKLLKVLEGNLERGRPESIFHVTQGVLTPDTGCIVRNLCTTLEEVLAHKVAPPFVKWLRARRAGRGGGINICILDFVELEGYVETVIRLNYDALLSDS